MGWIHYRLFNVFLTLNLFEQLTTMKIILVCITIFWDSEKDNILISHKRPFSWNNAVRCREAHYCDPYLVIKLIAFYTWLHVIGAINYHVFFLLIYLISTYRYLIIWKNPLSYSSAVLLISKFLDNHYRWNIVGIKIVFNNSNAWVVSTYS